MLEDASTICTQSGDLAACYHLARHFESQDEIKQAINFYKRAKKFNHGVRLAKEHRMDSELMTLALEGGKELKIEAARYFEAAQSYDKAVMLYQKGGKTPRALELCFRAQLFESLTKISENLDTDTDPALLTRCGDFCLENKKYDKAVHLFVTAKKYGKALELCMKFNVPINEKMAEAMTPAKTDDNKDARQDVLLNLAKCCHDQGNYGLACKKFTQAGDKVQAMQCLVKSKNTQKIVFYAKTIKKKEIWILAANYLQKLAWHSEPEVMKDIIQFYTKAKAWQQLAVFYDACAQVEIDEYRDYEKALGALKESLKYIIKTKSMADKEEKLASLDARIRLVEQFVQARQLVKTRPQEMVKICQRLLDTPDVDRDSAIRVGDVFALLIEYYHSQQMFQDAYQIIQKMKNGNIILAPYLDAKMVEEIHNQVGEDMPSNGQEENDDDDIGEEIGEDIE
jgi:intraflagellar transport protein 140